LSFSHAYDLNNQDKTKDIIYKFGEGIKQNYPKFYLMDYKGVQGGRSRITHKRLKHCVRLVTKHCAKRSTKHGNKRGARLVTKQSKKKKEGVNRRTKRK
jgi:hypothetical protein